MTQRYLHHRVHSRMGKKLWELHFLHFLLNLQPVQSDSLTTPLTPNCCCLFLFENKPCETCNFLKVLNLKRFASFRSFLFLLAQAWSTSMGEISQNHTILKCQKPNTLSFFSDFIDSLCMAVNGYNPLPEMVIKSSKCKGLEIFTQNVILCYSSSRSQSFIFQKLSKMFLHSLQIALIYFNQGYAFKWNGKISCMNDNRTTNHKNVVPQVQLQISLNTVDITMELKLSLYISIVFLNFLGVSQCQTTLSNFNAKVSYKHLLEISPCVFAY